MIEIRLVGMRIELDVPVEQWSTCMTEGKLALLRESLEQLAKELHAFVVATPECLDDNTETRH